MVCMPLCTDGPELAPAPTVYHVILGQPVSLVFGYNLHSNPPVTIVLTDPSEEEMNNSEIIKFDSGPEVVQIHITEAEVKHRGVWTCGLYHDNRDIPTTYVVTLVVLGK